MNNAAELVAKFTAADAAIKAGHESCRDLRLERARLMEGWADLVATGDHAEIARRSDRLADIGRELVRLGG